MNDPSPEGPQAKVPPLDLSRLMSDLAVEGPVRRRVVYHSAFCGAHPHCEGECMRQPRP